MRGTTQARFCSRKYRAIPRRGPVLFAGEGTADRPPLLRRVDSLCSRSNSIRPVVVTSDRARMRVRRTARTMFERFTDRARRAVVEAQEEARTLSHNYLGTEHILLGFIREGEGTGAKALESLGISLDTVRQQVQEIIGQGQHAPSGHIPFTPQAKKVLELSLSESKALGHHYIGTEHILLGLIREGDGVAAQVLVKLGADRIRVRQQVIQLLHDYQAKT